MNIKTAIDSAFASFQSVVDTSVPGIFLITATMSAVAVILSIISMLNKSK